MEPSARSGHIVISTVGLGNVGDQAMLEAFLDNSTEHVHVVMPATNSLTLPIRHAHRATLVHLPGLVDGMPYRRKNSRKAFVELVRSAKTCSVIGADIMDGGYSPRESVLRCSVLALAHRLGADTAVMGFSWNGNAHPLARDAIRGIASTTTLYARDPLSASRLKADGIRCTEVADTVFSFDQIDAPRDLLSWRSSQAHRRLVVVNASGLVASATMIREYVTAVSALRARDFAVLLVPHVLRQGDNDLNACSDVYSHFHADPAVHLVTRLMQPAEVSWIVSEAEAVFTGRMHLAILSLNHGTPPCVVSTQGKVEGMLSLFGLERYSLEPTVGLGSRAFDSILELTQDGLRDRLVTIHPTVRDMALSQFRHVNQHASHPRSLP
ncbi:polysaccharide pyruvyl transferase family protein [Nocardioides sp. zg-ZUI104]|nr:polysaccharide pyruvyl transferase family protein [Nocardioides faecalis]